MQRQDEKEAIDHTNTAVDKMCLLLNDLSEISRISRLMNPPQEIPLEDLSNEAISLVGGQIAARGVTVEISPDLPCVFGDGPRLLEVMQNLVENIVKFMGDQPHPVVEIGTRQQNGEIICYVQDSGIGIAPRYHERIFDLFERLDHKEEGSGIGLALVKRIVEVHGGRIWVESENEGEGSTFCFTLPPEGEHHSVDKS